MQCENSLIDQLFIAFSEIYLHCMSGDAKDSYNEILCCYAENSYPLEPKVTIPYLRSSLPALADYQPPECVEVELETNLQYELQQQNYSREEIKALVLCKHILLKGLYDANLEFFMTLAAAECSPAQRTVLSQKFNAYFNVKENRYQIMRVSAQEREFPNTAEIVSYQVNGVEQPL